MIHKAYNISKLLISNSHYYLLAYINFACLLFICGFFFCVFNFSLFVEYYILSPFLGVFHEIYDKFAYHRICDKFTYHGICDEFSMECSISYLLMNWKYFFLVYCSFDWYFQWFLYVWKNISNEAILDSIVLAPYGTASKKVKKMIDYGIWTVSNS